MTGSGAKLISQVGLMCSYYKEYVFVYGVY